MNLKSVAPKKSLGQNFLIDRNIAAKTVGLLNIQTCDNVVEIGPGTGALTSLLLETGCNLTAIEIDQRAIEELNKKFPAEKYPNFKLIHSDFRDYNFIAENEKIKVIGNIPYYLSSEIFFKLFESSQNLSMAVLTIQKELAKRLIAQPKSKDYGILTLAMMMSGNCKIEFDVSPSCFYPAPNVMSSVIRMDFNCPKFKVSNYNKTMNIVRAAFNQRRKMLGNSLKSLFQRFETIEMNDELRLKIVQMSKQRPEELLPSDFAFLAEFPFAVK